MNQKFFLLLRGLARDSRHWMDFPSILQKEMASDSNSVICIDLPGTGMNINHPSPLSISEITDFIRLEWQKNSPPSECYILAVSLGGMVALDWLARYPDDFKIGFILNSSASNLAMPWQRMRWQNWWKIISLPFRSARAQEKTILELTVSSLEKQQQLLPLWTKWNQIKRISIINVISQIIAAARFHCSQIKNSKIIFMASAQDQLVNPICSKLLAENYHSNIFIHPKAGHDLSLDDPHWVIEKMKIILANERINEERNK